MKELQQNKPHPMTSQSSHTYQLQPTEK